MKVHHFVIHYIQKDQFRAPTPKLRDSEADLSKSKSPDGQKPDLIHKFVDSAATMFNRQRSGRVYADVGKEGNTFSEILDKYLDGKIDFLAFSKRLAKELVKSMKDVSLATGGYMAIAEYSASPKQLLIIMIKQEVGYAVDPDTLELRESIHLDLGTINVGAQIDLEAYQRGDVHHLALVRGLKDLAKYFRNFLGVENFKSAKDETLELANVMEGYFKTKPDKYSVETVADIRRQVAGLIKQHKGGNTSLMAIAGIVNSEDPEDFHQYANDLGVSADVQSDPEVIKGWVRVVYKDPRLFIDFDKKLFHESVEWDPTNDELRITVSAFPKLAEKLDEADQ